MSKIVCLSCRRSLSVLTLCLSNAFSCLNKSRSVERHTREFFLRVCAKQTQAKTHHFSASSIRRSEDVRPHTCLRTLEQSNSCARVVVIRRVEAAPRKGELGGVRRARASAGRRRRSVRAAFLLRRSGRAPAPRSRNIFVSAIAAPSSRLRAAAHLSYPLCACL